MLDVITCIAATLLHRQHRQKPLPLPSLLHASSPRPARLVSLEPTHCSSIPSWPAAPFLTLVYKPHHCVPGGAVPTLVRCMNPSNTRVQECTKTNTIQVSTLDSFIPFSSPNTSIYLLNASSVSFFITSPNECSAAASLNRMKSWSRPPSSLKSAPTETRSQLPMRTPRGPMILRGFCG